MMAYEELSLDTYPSHVTTGTVSLGGGVPRPARIELSRGTVVLVEANSGPDNRFSFQSISLEPGENNFKLTVRPLDSDQYSHSREFTVVWEPAKPAAPTLNTLPAIINLPEFSVSGMTHPTATVRIVVAAIEGGSQKTDDGRSSKTQNLKTVGKPSEPSVKLEPITGETIAGPDGYFQTTFKLNQPGRYKISAIASNSSGVTGPSSSELEFAYDPQWYPMTGDLLTQSGNAIIRKATLVLGHKRMRTTLAATLPRNHPAVTTLLSHKRTLDEFFAEIFSLKFNNIYYVGRFENAASNISVNQNLATISASSNIEVNEFLPLFHGEVKISGNAGFPFDSPNDSLTINISDYSVRALDPAPSTLNQNVYTWTGVNPHTTPPSQSSDYFRNLDGVTLQLDYNPLASPRNLLRMTQLSPYSFWGYPWNSVVALLVGLLGVVPIVWTLWLVQQPAYKTLIDEGLRISTSNLALTLLTIGLVVPVLFLSWAIAYAIRDFEFMGQLRYDYTTIRFISSVAIVVLATLSQLVSRRLAKKTYGVWLKSIAIGIRNAAIIAAFTVVTEVGAHRVISRSAAFIVLAVSSGFVWFYLGKVIRQFRISSRYLILLKVATICIFLALAVPVLNPYSNYNPQSWPFLSILQDLAPYFMMIALLVLLKKLSDVSDSRAKVLALNIGLILFTSYIVGTTANLFLIPVPFILAIWLFSKFLIRNLKERQELASVSEEVVTVRSQLIQTVIASDLAQQFKGNLDKLRDKVFSGDLTLEAFEARTMEIESYAKKKEQASLLSNGLPARDGVLSVGPYLNNWQNGVWSASRGALLIFPFLCAYIILLIVRSGTFSQQPYAILFLADQITTFVFDWLIAAFFFGYFFRDIQGDYGLNKAWRTAGLVIICLLPSWLSQISTNIDLISVFFRGVQTFLFFTVLGIWAFDYQTFRGALGEQFRWRTFARFGKVPTLTAAASLVLPGVSLILTTLFTGRIPELIAKLIGAAFPKVSAGPP